VLGGDGRATRPLGRSAAHAQPSLPASALPTPRPHLLVTPQPLLAGRPPLRTPGRPGTPIRAARAPRRRTQPSAAAGGRPLPPKQRNPFDRLRGSCRRAPSAPPAASRPPDFHARAPSPARGAHARRRRPPARPGALRARERPPADAPIPRRRPVAPPPPARKPCIARAIVNRRRPVRLDGGRVVGGAGCGATCVRGPPAGRPATLGRVMPRVGRRGRRTPKVVGWAPGSLALLQTEGRSRSTTHSIRCGAALLPNEGAPGAWPAGPRARSSRRRARRR
jgi:hypothetical protein